MEYNFDEVKQTDSNSDTLSHYGVKGMRWGVRRGESSNDAPNPRYKKNLQDRDRNAYGEKGVKRINRRMNTGMSRSKAVRRENLRNVAITAAVTAGSIASVMVLEKHGDQISSGVSSLAETGRGKAEAGKTFASNKANSGKTFAKGVVGKGMETFSPSQSGQIRGVKMRVNTESSGI